MDFNSPTFWIVSGIIFTALVFDYLKANLESEVPVSRERFDLKDAIDQQLLAKRHLLSANDLQTAVDCPAIEIEADRSRLMRAVSNLLDNAIHYNRLGGSIRVSVAVTGSYVRIEVADTGPGIPPADLARIFERFYRIDKSRTRDSGGTGLGLAVARHAIESQGGTLSVTSRVGAGSTFVIQLPAN